MPTYTYECLNGVHGRFDVRKRMADAGLPVWCCDGPPARRIYNPQRIIVRPLGYNLKPGEVRRDGLAYDDFSRELALGDLREDATGAYTPESRAKREAELATADAYRPRPMAEIDRDIPERAHQELHEWGRAAYSRLEELRDR